MDSRSSFSPSNLSKWRLSCLAPYVARTVVSSPRLGGRRLLRLSDEKEVAAPRLRSDSELRPSPRGDRETDRPSWELGSKRRRRKPRQWATTSRKCRTNGRGSSKFQSKGQSVIFPSRHVLLLWTVVRSGPKRWGRWAGRWAGQRRRREESQRGVASRVPLFCPLLSASPGLPVGRGEGEPEWRLRSLDVCEDH